MFWTDKVITFSLLSDKKSFENINGNLLVKTVEGEIKLLTVENTKNDLIMVSCEGEEFSFSIEAYFNNKSNFTQIYKVE